MGKNTERVIVRVNEKGEVILLFPGITHQGRMTSWNAETKEHGDGLPAEFKPLHGLAQRSAAETAMAHYGRSYKTELVRVAG